MKQILESGSPASSAIFDPSDRGSAWQTFVSSVSSCTQTATSGHTLDCLRRANPSDIAQALRASLSAWAGVGPALDGPNGLIPDYPSKLLARGQLACVPFIAGANLDEGEEIALFSVVLILFTPQELFSPIRASIQRMIFMASSSRCPLRRSLRQRSLRMWHRTSCVYIQIFLPWDPHSAPVTRLLV